MKELDLLKKDWKKDTNTFEQLSEGTIYKMIQKHSSSLAKWILIISILEFLILNGISLFINDEKIDGFLIKHPYLEIINYLNYLVVISFIVIFYKKYRSISVLDSSKNLIEQIKTKLYRNDIFIPKSIFDIIINNADIIYFNEDNNIINANNTIKKI